MENWQKELLDKAEEVVKHGWGRVEFIVTKNGRRKQYSKTITDVEDEEPLRKSRNMI
ncbi:hypothetical protein KAW50_00335 [candidate division WOR-3 bacterium]|nr:hypothetical protein [candidate division WOR-3 bacterium]